MTQQQPAVVMRYQVVCPKPLKTVSMSIIRDVEVQIEHVEGLDECKKVLMLAKAGRKNGYLIEGMGCPGGCVAGAGTLIPVPNAKKEVQQIVTDSTKKLPPKQLREIELK